jgi:hypothetical protein
MSEVIKKLIRFRTPSGTGPLKLTSSDIILRLITGNVRFLMGSVTVGPRVREN